MGAVNLGSGGGVQELQRDLIVLQGGGGVAKLDHAAHQVVRIGTTVVGPALQNYQIALQFLNASPGTEVHRAHVTAQTASFALAQDKGPEILPDLNAAIDVMTRAENASLLATLLLLKSEALKQAGQEQQARAVRLDSIGWARYGFGSDLVARSLAEGDAGTSRNNTGG
jgi:hypothetical protein